MSSNYLIPRNFWIFWKVIKINYFIKFLQTLRSNGLQKRLVYFNKPFTLVRKLLSIWKFISGKTFAHWWRYRHIFELFMIWVIRWNREFSSVKVGVAVTIVSRTNNVTFMSSWAGWSCGHTLAGVLWKIKVFLSIVWEIDSRNKKVYLNRFQTRILMHVVHIDSESQES